MSHEPANPDWGNPEVFKVLSRTKSPQRLAEARALLRTHGVAARTSRYW